MEIQFFPLARILRYAVCMILFQILPLLMAILLQWAESKPLTQLHFSNIVIWLVISIPLAFICWIAWLRRAIYNHPVVYQILSDGKKKRIRIRKGNSAARLLRFVQGLRLRDIGTALFVIGLPLLMFIMSAYLIRS